MIKEHIFSKKSTLLPLEAILDLEQMQEVDRPWNLQDFYNDFLFDEFQLFCLENQNHFIGFLLLKKWMQSNAEVRRFLIHPQWRLQGFGSKLLRLALNQSLSWASFWDLEVRSQNQEAIALYEKFGFQPTGKKTHYADYASGIQMRLDAKTWQVIHESSNLFH